MDPEERPRAYNADITYGTNNEFGFDYLRDNMALSLEDCVQREHHFAIVDEVDSILIDEARTPLIISGPAEDSHAWYPTFAKLVDRLKRDEHYEVDEKKKTVAILENGIDVVEDRLGIDNLYESANTPLISYLNAIKAKELFKLDRDYVNLDGEILIVDEHTGRTLVGRRYNEGLHQAIEAKEKVQIRTACGPTGARSSRSDPHRSFIGRSSSASSAAVASGGMQPKAIVERYLLEVLNGARPEAASCSSRTSRSDSASPAFARRSPTSR